MLGYECSSEEKIWPSPSSSPSLLSYLPSKIFSLDAVMSTTKMANPKDTSDHVLCYHFRQLRAPSLLNAFLVDSITPLFNRRWCLGTVSPKRNCHFCVEHFTKLERSMPSKYALRVKSACFTAMSTSSPVLTRTCVSCTFAQVGSALCLRKP